MSLKGARCVNCTGTKATHGMIEPGVDEGCWCAACLKMPIEARCRDWRPVEHDGRKPLDRKVAPVGHRHPATAKDAAGRAELRSGTQRALVYGLILAKTRLGMTDDELEDALSKSHQSVSATRNTLMNDGWIVDSGLRRRTRYGNDAIVWVTAEVAVALEKEGLLGELSRPNS